MWCVLCCQLHWPWPVDFVTGVCCVHQLSVTLALVSRLRRWGVFVDCVQEYVFVFLYVVVSSLDVCMCWHLNSHKNICYIIVAAYIMIIILCPYSGSGNYIVVGELGCSIQFIAPYIILYKTIIIVFVIMQYFGLGMMIMFENVRV